MYLKYKRFIWIAFAVLFLVVLFLIKTGFTLKNTENYQASNEQNGLAYSAKTIEELATKDTDGDTVPDWEEKLWGTDPNKTETTAGTPDSVAIERLRADQIIKTGTTGNSQNGGVITQTDQFSRDLFTTIAAASQDGQPLDQTTADKISNSLADHIQNSPPKKVYTLLDIKILNDDSTQAVTKYQSTLGTTYKKYAIYVSVYDILAESIKNDDININVLNKLDPIIKNMNAIVTEMLSMKVPQSLSALHLEVINDFQKVSENITDIKAVNTDAILTMSAVSQYQKNDDQLAISIANLIAEINKKLNN
ncbi:MAG: hypothetical protein WCP17_02040 [bacterium]